MLKGINASPGIAYGKVLILEHIEPYISKVTINDSELEEKKLLDAVEKARKDLIRVRDRALKDLGEDKAKIFETYLLVLQDPGFIDMAIEKIRDEKINAEYAISEVRDMFISMFEAMDDEYMLERVADIKDVSGRIIKHILGIKQVDLSVLENEVILVTRDLTPSDTALMDKDKVIGFLTDIGGVTSHTAIMARALEIPAIVGLKNITESLKNEDSVVFNGATGEVYVNPDAKLIAEFLELKNSLEREKNELRDFVGKETKTLDGIKVELAANIGSIKYVDSVIDNDAEGVGLYRTEFLYMETDKEPNEDEQFNAYKSVAQRLNPKPIVIRTLDIGGDKELPYLNIEKEANPFLGYRAIRICLDRTDLFKTQLRALLRASMYGNIKIMFPMISSVQELLKAKALLEKAKNELKEEGISFKENIEVGMMIEVPSAAIISDIFAKYVDFFSIGTNDLIQYTCAVDRMNEKINHLYSQYNPGVLRLIKLVIDNAHKNGKWVGMCGESAGDGKMIPILLGLGLDEFSMSASSILGARRLINSLRYEEAKKLAEKVLEFETDEEIENFMCHGDVSSGTEV